MADYKLNYHQRIKDILADPTKTNLYLDFSKSHNFYDSSCPIDIMVAEAYSRYRAYPYLAHQFGEDRIVCAPVSARHDFEIAGRKIDTKVRTTNHTDYNGDVFVDTSKWEINDAIIIVWEDGYSALFPRKTTPTTRDIQHTNKCSTHNNTDKVAKDVTHINYNDAMYKWIINGSN